jgi:hypothetical protein
VDFDAGKGGNNRDAARASGNALITAQRIFLS